jgi:hypothetical protein
MGLLQFFKTKKSYSDGSRLWPSGREIFSYVDQNGIRIEFSVFHTTSKSDRINVVVAASFAYIDGSKVLPEKQSEIISKLQIYFSEKKNCCALNNNSQLLIKWNY